MRPLALLPAALLAASLAPAALAQGGPLRIGQSIVLTGPTAEHGKAVLAGAQAAIAKANAEGGIRGRRLELKAVDDGGNGKQSGENARAFAKDPSVVALFGGVGGGSCVAQSAVAKEASIPLVACMAGSPGLRDGSSRYVIPMRVSHTEEFAVLIDQALRYGMNRIALVHDDNDTGRLHLANLKKLLAAKGKDLALAIPLSAKADPAILAQRLADERIEVVFNQGPYAAYGGLVKAARARGLTVQFMAVNSGAQQLVKQLGPDAKGLIFTQVVPYPWDAQQPVVREYQAALRKADPQAAFSFSSLEGYLGAKVLVEGLKRAKAPTREGLVQGFESIGALDLGGYSVSYAPGALAGANLVDTVIATARGDFRH